MLTDNDIQKLIAAFEKKFATKDDLKGFATKDDFKGFATKDDFKGFATKEELLQFKDEIFGRLNDIQDDIAILAGHQDIWENHEKRLTNVEIHVFRN